MSIETNEEIKLRVEKTFKESISKIQIISPESYILYEDCELKVFLKSKVIEDLMKKLAPPADSPTLATNIVGTGVWHGHSGYNVGKVFNQCVGKEITQYHGEGFGGSASIFHSASQEFNPYMLATKGLGEGVLFKQSLFPLNGDMSELLKGAVEKLYKCAKRFYISHKKTIFMELDFSVRVYEA